MPVFSVYSVFFLKSKLGKQKFCPLAVWELVRTQSHDIIYAFCVFSEDTAVRWYPDYRNCNSGIIHSVLDHGTEAPATSGWSDSKWGGCGPVLCFLLSHHGTENELVPMPGAGQSHPMSRTRTQHIARREQAKAELQLCVQPGESQEAAPQLQYLTGLPEWGACADLPHPAGTGATVSMTSLSWVGTEGEERMLKCACLGCSKCSVLHRHIYSYSHP